MAAKKQNRNNSKKPLASSNQQPDTSPLTVGRVTRRRMHNRDSHGLVALIGYLWAKYDAQLNLDGSSEAYLDGKGNMVLTVAVKKQIDMMLCSISFSERYMSDDESFGIYICDLILKSVCKHLGIFYVAI